MTDLADTCVLYRAGPEGLQAMQQGAQAVLDAGGSASLAGRRQLHELDQQLLALNASPVAPPTCWPPACLSTASTERCDGNLIL